MPLTNWLVSGFRIRKNNLEVKNSNYILINYFLIRPAEMTQSVQFYDKNHIDYAVKFLDTDSWLSPLL